jgi:hypothetical protein
MAVTIQIDTREIAKIALATRKIADGVKRVLAPAVNRALSAGRTAASREIRANYLIKNKDIPMRIQQSGESGAILIESGMLKLYDFKVAPKGVQRRARKKPVFAQVKVGGGAYLGGGFVAQMKSGHVGVFMRSSSRMMFTKPWKQQINELLTIGAPIMATQPAVGPAVNERMGEVLEKRMDHELNRVLRSAG